MLIFSHFPVNVKRKYVAKSENYAYNSTYCKITRTKVDIAMDRMRIAALFADKDSLGGKEVVVCGWARTIRDMKGFGFVELNDGSCFKNLQVVLDANLLEN